MTNARWIGSSRASACALGAVLGAWVPSCGEKGPNDAGPPNHPPLVVSATPPLWSLVPGMSEGDQIFKLRIADNDSWDILEVRWMANYPPVTSDTRLLGTSATPGGYSQPRLEASPVVDCVFSRLPSDLKEHRIVAIISDRPFLRPGDATYDPLQPYESVPPDGNRITVGWILQKECPP